MAFHIDVSLLTLSARKFVIVVVSIAAEAVNDDLINVYKCDLNDDYHCCLTHITVKGKTT